MIEIISIKIRFHKTGELNGSRYVKLLLRSNAILNIENNDKDCFLLSILACLHPCGNSHPSRVRNVVMFINLKNRTINIFELNFHQDQNKWKHNLIPIEICKNVSDKFVDLLIYRNHYALIKKLNVFSTDGHKIFI